MSTTTSTEDRLQRLEDRDAIHQLFVDYGRNLDAGDWDAYAGLFAEDGEVKLGGIGKAQGRDEIRALMAGAIGDKVGGVFHVIGSPAVTLDGDTATAVVQWVAIGKAEDGAPALMSMGEHIDALTRTDAGWRIQRRTGRLSLARGYSPR